MYSERWSRCLRQGDILGGVWFPGRAFTVKVTVPDVGTGSGMRPFTDPMLSAAAHQSDVMVISHDCEFNEGKRTHFIVARIEGVSNISPDEMAVRLSANSMQTALELGIPLWADSFPLAPSRTLFGDERYRRVNFCRVMSLPMTDVAAFLEQKKAELMHQDRQNLRFKLGAFFGRAADDIPDEDKYVPDASIRTQPH